MDKTKRFVLIGVLLSVLLLAAPAMADDNLAATRDILDQTVDPGATFTVTLTLTANENVQAPALDEDLPAGWTVTEVDSAGATYKASTTEWIWSSAMSSGASKTVVYNVTVPADATPQDYEITGNASAYGVDPIGIGGESTVTVTGEAATTGDIVINEIMYAPTAAYGGQYNEWIELYNNDTKDIDITDWVVDGKTISLGTLMQPSDYVIIARNDTKFAEYYSGVGCTVLKVTIGLPNDGEMMCLNDSSSTVISSVNYTEYAAMGMANVNNMTLERNATGGWEESLVDGGTPCAENSVLADVYDVTISQPADQTTTEGVNATYVLTVTNTGNTADTYTLSCENINSASTAALDKATLTLAAGAEDVVTLHVTNAAAGTFNVTVTAASADATATTDSIMTTVEVAISDPISATRDISDQTVDPGATFTVMLTLTANEDVQAPALDEDLPVGWTVTEVDNAGATYKASTIEWIWLSAMSSGESKTVIYNVTVPADATPQDYEITGNASAYGVDPIGIGGESTVTVTALAAYPMDVTANTTSVHKDITSEVLFNVTSDGAPVNNATVMLSGCGVDGTNGTTDENGTVTISVTATSKGTITVTVTKDTYDEATTTVAVTAYPMTVTAVPDSVLKDTATEILFNVTSDGSPVDGALVTLLGCGVDTNGTTDENGTVTISVTATSTGTIDVTATKDTYEEATATVDVTAYPMNVTAVPTSVVKGTTVDVLFNVTSDGSPVDNATVTLLGCGVNRNGTTDVNGTVTISVTATSTGTIDVTATKDTYEDATTTVAVTTPSNGGGSSGSSGDGTYPPGWGEPASTPTATPAPTAAPEPTVAPDEAATPAPTEAPTRAPTAAETEIATTELPTKGTPGFGAVLAVFAIAGLLVAAYLVMRRRE